MKPSTHRRAAPLWALTALLAALAGCGRNARGTDLLREEAPVEATLSSRRALSWAHAQMGRPFRINDVVLRSLPAPPTSRLRFRADVPASARVVGAIRAQDWKTAASLAARSSGASIFMIR